MGYKIAFTVIYDDDVMGSGETDKYDYLYEAIDDLKCEVELAAWQEDQDTEDN